MTPEGKELRVQFWPCYALFINSLEARPRILYPAGRKMNFALTDTREPAKASPSNGREDNKLRPEDRAAHDWYRFVLSYPAHLVRTCLERFQLGPDAIVLDPFCGTGTTLVECKKQGIQSYGIEPNPMAHFATNTKVDWEVDPDALLAHATEVSKITLSKLAAQGLDDEDALPLLQRQGTFTAELRSLPKDAFKLLLTNSISPLPLHKTLVLLETVEEHRNPRFENHERLALAKALVNNISNLISALKSVWVRRSPTVRSCALGST